MKNIVKIEYILASTYEDARVCARNNGIKEGWKFLHSIIRIYGTRGATVLLADSAKQREDYSYFLIELRLRDSIVMYAPYIRELV